MNNPIRPLTGSEIVLHRFHQTGVNGMYCRLQLCQTLSKPDLCKHLTRLKATFMPLSLQVQSEKGQYHFIFEQTSALPIFMEPIQEVYSDSTDSLGVWAVWIDDEVSIKTLTFWFHHGVMDGMSLLQFLQGFLGLVAGQDIQFLSSVSTVDLPQPSSSLMESLSFLWTNRRFISSPVPFCMGDKKLFKFQLDCNLTERLKQKAQEANTTLYAWLGSVVSEVYFEVFQLSKICLWTPVDLGTYYGHARTQVWVGNYQIPIPMTIKKSSSSASDFQTQLADGLSGDLVETTASLLNLVGKWPVLRYLIGGDILFSHLGDYEVPGCVSSCDFWSPLSTCLFYVSSGIRNGCLDMTISSINQAVSEKMFRLFCENLRLKIEGG